MSGLIGTHYNQPDLLARIERAIGAAGKTPDTVTMDDLAGIEEFHIGARAATVPLLGELGLEPCHRALDIGCGTGGTARFAAHRYGCKVDGVDVTPGFIEAGKTINAWLGLGSKVTLQRASALDMPFEDDHFDAAWMFHVGMNIEDKRGLFAEICRTLKPGAPFLVYDIMQGGEGDNPVIFPVPWAGTPDISFLRSADDYEELLETTGFAIDKVQPRQDIADRFFDRMAAGAEKPAPALSIATLMGDQAREKAVNLMANYRAGRIVPVEILARKG